MNKCNCVNSNILSCNFLSNFIKFGSEYESTNQSNYLHSFPITDDVVKPILDGDSLCSLAKNKRLFITDLALMEGVPTVKHCGKQLTVCRQKD